MKTQTKVELLLAFLSGASSFGYNAEYLPPIFLLVAAVTATLIWMVPKSLNQYYLPHLFYYCPTREQGEHTESERCELCKKGVGNRIAIINTDSIDVYCPCCHQRFQGEPNTNFSHVWWLKKQKIKKFFFKIMDILHIVKLGGGSDIMYVTVNFETGENTPTYYKRKWGIFSKHTAWI